jgi:hypothetical protein
MLRAEVLAQMKARLPGCGIVGKRKEISKVLLIDSKKRRNVRGEPPVFLAGNDKLIDIGFAICASQLMRQRRSDAHQMKLVSNIRSF